MMMYKPQPIKKPTNFKTLPLGLPLAVAAVSAGVMALFVYLAEKKHITWVENFSIAGSMLAGMAAAVLIGLV